MASSSKGPLKNDVDCFNDAVKGKAIASAAADGGGGVCLGCKEPCRYTNWEEVVSASDDEATLTRALSLPRSLGAEPKKEQSTASLMEQTGTNDGDQAAGDELGFDHGSWIFETNGAYGYGSAIWPEDKAIDDDQGGSGGGVPAPRRPKELVAKPWRPLTRKIKIPAAVLSPYRVLVLVRLVALGFFLMWRYKHKNEDAVWLWGISVVCELWFAFSWLLDQLPKLCPVNRATDLSVLRDRFEPAAAAAGKSDLPGVDVFVSTADPEKEPVLVTANTILSILAADYPVEKLACYVSDDGGALLTFEAMAEAASFAALWVPFCRKHGVEPRSPESYFALRRDPLIGKVRADFVGDRRRMKRRYDEFKVRVNGLPDTIRRRSDAYHAREEIQAVNLQRERMAKGGGGDGGGRLEPVRIPRASWTADGAHWPGTWLRPSQDHSRGDHAGIIQVMLKPPSDTPVHGSTEEEQEQPLNFSGVDTRLPMLVYASREKRPGYDHNKKGGAMNALVRASAIMSNGPFILNVDCDHYVYNSKALREGMCFMMDRGGNRLCYVQFPQRFEGIDPSDRYANHNTVFFDVNMRALDGLQGPVYVGTGCLFRRIALYGFDPPCSEDHAIVSRCFLRRRPKTASDPNADGSEETTALRMGDINGDSMDLATLPKRFGNSSNLINSIPVAEFEGRPLADHPSVKNGRPPGALTVPRGEVNASIVAEVVNVISCWYEDKTEWGTRVGWIYGSITEDVVTGYRMHNRGWNSVYCITQRDAFRGTAPINLTYRLHQVLRWATGSVEIFFSRNNALFASSKMKLLQRIAYLNVGIYPFTSIFLIVYCFLPALSLLSGQFIVQTLSVAFLAYLLTITATLCLLAVLEIRWSGVSLEEWWRNEQFWLIGGTSAHLVAVVQGFLKVVAGVETSFTLTSKQQADGGGGGDDADVDEFAELHEVRWSLLMVPPLAVIMVNLVAVAVGVSRTVYSAAPQWSKLLGGVFFSFWVLAHLYPFAKGLMGRRGRTPTVVYLWAGLIAATISLVWTAIRPPSPAASSQFGGSAFTFP